MTAIVNPADLKHYIRAVPDFPKPGIMFRDITPLLAHPPALKAAVQAFARAFADDRPNVIMAAESRGFIFGAPLAIELGAAFVPVRKPGKLPFETRRLEYDLEYGSDALEIHIDAVDSNSRVLLIDDLLATGGTIEACLKLAEQSGAAVVGCGFLIELSFLSGRKRLEPRKIVSLIEYHNEQP